MNALLATLLGPLSRVPGFEPIELPPTVPVAAVEDPPASEAPEASRAVSRCDRGPSCEHYATVLRLEAECDVLRSEVLRLEAAAIKPHSPVWEVEW